MPNSKLPEHPSLDHLKKLAKNRLQELRRNDPEAKLTTAQLEVAREYGFTSWRALKAQLDDRRAKKVASPVMRFLPVANLSRSVAFYRDVLGFEIREVLSEDKNEDKNEEKTSVEAVMGPARIRFGKEGYAPTDWTTPKPPGSAILFVQSDDVEALHAALRARGAKPSTIERVNWIKMRMFQVRDPDGHVLWFGQSYNQPVPPAPPPMMQKALPELPFDDVPRAVMYYRDVLGFRINYQQSDLGVMERDEITVLLIARSEQHKGIGSFAVYVENADGLYAELLTRGANLQGEPVSRPWGLRDFRVLDYEGNRITFAQTFE
jgi:uncharacterized glyoxalase superfamily protein PhnB